MSQYTIIACVKCEHVQIVKGSPHTTGCKSCGKRLTLHKLKTLFTTDSGEEARRMRGAIAADIAGEKSEFETAMKDIDTEELNSGFNADEYLRDQGLDPEEIREQVGTNQKLSRREKVAIVTKVIGQLNPATHETVVEFAGIHGVSEDDVEKVIDFLSARGELITTADKHLKLL